MSHLKCVTNREGKQETTRKMLHRFLRKSWIVEPGQMVFEHCNFPVEDLQYQYDIYIYVYQHLSTFMPALVPIYYALVP